jgi:hypothetical protein
MNFLSKFDRGGPRFRPALACLCVLFVSSCGTEAVVLSPSMHARVIDGVTGKPLDHVRVTLLSRDAPVSEMSYSDLNGIVDMPGLAGQESVSFGFFAATMIDSVNGYGFFKGYTNVRLYPD